MIEYEIEKTYSIDDALKYIKDLIDKISPRFTKAYNYISNEKIEQDGFYNMEIEFYEPETKKPVAQHKVKLIFKIPINLNETGVQFQIENEAVSYPLFDSVNLTHFETLIDRIINNKEKSCQSLLLHTNFESTRIVSLNGDSLKLYTIEEEESILTNNNSEYFRFNANFNDLNTESIDRLIQLLWKTLNDENSEKINLEKFNYLFLYGKLNFSETNIKKLWNYTDRNKNGEIDFQEFVYFCLNLIHCLRAFYISKYKADNSLYIANKIETAVDIMNTHFKEYDFEENHEISYENLKKCLSKESELFSRKDIEIILKQINPNHNFEYWKFDKILKILFEDNFDYSQLMKVDKIYKYLINIFSNQDLEKNGRLHYKKMKYALLIEPKLKLNKIQILIILNLFDVNTNPELDYYKVSLIIRNIIDDLFSIDKSMQKIEILEKLKKYREYKDVYDAHINNIKTLFIDYDEDFDHLLSKKEFFNMLSNLIPFCNDLEKEEMFIFTNTRKNGKISFPELKENFSSIVKMIRIKNVLKEVSDII